MNRTIDSAITKAKARGYRMTTLSFVDSRTKTCCPMGAVMMFSWKQPTNNYIASFSIGFDGTSPSKMKDIDMQAYENGKEYRKKFLANRL